MIDITLPWRGKPKPRPQVTRNGTYNPKEYTQWKRDIAEFIAVQNLEVIDQPFEIYVTFASEEVRIQIRPHDEWPRAKYVTGDIDNLLGGTLDALQDAGLITNDRLAIRAIASIERR